MIKKTEESQMKVPDSNAAETTTACTEKLTKERQEAAKHLIVALDCHDLQQVTQLLQQLQGLGVCYKVGMELYNSVGPQILELLAARKERVFLDLKFHDIPNTVAQAGLNAVRQGVWMYNLHIGGGREMMETTVRRSQELARQEGLLLPLMIGVTVLTSISQDSWRELGWSQPIAATVAHWAALGQSCGLDGVVCSPQEIAAVRAACGPGFKIVTPGVRPLWAANNDQKRIMTPKEAILQGADYLVVGRPITRADNPRSAAEKVLREINEALVQLS